MRYLKKVKGTGLAKYSIYTSLDPLSVIYSPDFSAKLHVDNFIMLA